MKQWKPQYIRESLFNYLLSLLLPVSAITVLPARVPDIPEPSSNGPQVILRTSKDNEDKMSITYVSSPSSVTPKNIFYNHFTPSTTLRQGPYTSTRANLSLPLHPQPTSQPTNPRSDAKYQKSSKSTHPTKLPQIHRPPKIHPPTLSLH